MEVPKTESSASSRLSVLAGLHTYRWYW